MKLTKSLVLGFLLISLGSMNAQSPDREISKETTLKKYTMYEEGQLVKKSVEIHTIIRKAIKFDTLAENNINAQRIQTPKEITKVVNIDNDSDEAYDETIQFSYTTDASKNFVMKVNDDEIFTALENSKYLNVKDNKNMSEENLNEMIVITDNNGKTIELALEEYESQE